LFYREPFRLKFLDQKSRESIKTYTNDLVPVKYVSTNISDLELMLFYCWNGAVKKLSDISNDYSSPNSPNLLKNKLIFLLASTNSVASDFSDLNFMSGLFLDETYYCEYGKISSRSFDALNINNLFNSFCTYSPTVLNKKIIRHGAFFISNGKYYRTNQLKSYDFNDVPKIQKDFKAFNTYFSYTRSLFNALYFSHNSQASHKYRFLSFLNITIFLIIFLTWLFYYNFVNPLIFTNVYLFFDKVYCADLQHKFIYLGFKRVDLEFINFYLTDLTQDKFIKGCKYISWSLLWSFKIALLCRVNTMLTIPFFRTMVGPIGIEIRREYPAYDDLFDHWWF